MHRGVAKRSAREFRKIGPREHDHNGTAQSLQAGQSLNLALVEGGRATVPRSCPETRFLMAQERAQQAGRGVWSNGDNGS